MSSPPSTPVQADLQDLTALLAKYAPHDDHFTLADHNIHIARTSHPQSEKNYMLSQPSLCIISQGAKRVSCAQQTFDYDSNNMVVYAAEVPLLVKVTEASPEQPHYCLIIPLDPTRLQAMIAQVFPHGLPKQGKTQAVYVRQAQAALVKSAIRLMQLIEENDHADLLVPHMLDEIVIRLLRSPVGPAIAQIGTPNAPVERINKAISWLKDHYTQPLKIDDLAHVAGMSVSAFHGHFKDITALTPLQFQKTLRLQKARLLIQTSPLDVSQAAYEVGYSSSSQFSREYRRYFGVAPSQDSAAP